MNGSFKFVNGAPAKDAVIRVHHVHYVKCDLLCSSVWGGSQGQW
jgi:hypothetical protein